MFRGWRRSGFVGAAFQPRILETKEGTMKKTIWIFLCALSLAACGGEQTTETVENEAAAPAEVSQPEAAQDTARAELEVAEAEKLLTLFDEYWEENLKLSPITATSIGDPRYNDLMPDFYSAEYREQSRAFNEGYLERVREIDRDLLSGQDRLSYDMFVRDRELTLEGMQFPDWLMPMSQYNLYGFAAQMGSGASIQPFATVEDYENWFKRVARLEVITDTAIANMREGLSKGYSRPRAVMEKVVTQLDGLVVDDVETSPLWQSIDSMPEDIPETERTRLADEYRTLLTETVMPAYLKMRDYLRDEYVPNSRESFGYSELPDGKDWYAYLVKTHTTTDLTPEEIHEIGKQEVARILDEMRQVMAEVGFEGDLQDFFEYVQVEDSFYFDSSDEVIAGYDALRERVQAVLPDYFDIFPKAGFEIRPVEEFRAQTAAGASYMPGTPDGSRPGVFYVNTFNLKAQPKFGMETLYIHEAEPGHHFAISIAQEIEDLPMFRRFGGETAYDEGWALYAESIGREMGMFTDPYQYYGRLNDEQLRAMRLVVDTGLHYFGWTREQAIEYMRQNSSMAATDIESEVERYMTIAGQALAYKIGQRAIREMRNRAEKELGDDFDIKAFHRQILIDGSLPMGVLGTKIDEWVASEKERLAEAA